MTDAVTSLPGTLYSVRLYSRPPPKGWVLRAGPPALSGVFLSIFFLRRRRKNMAPGGRQPFRMEKNKTQKPASQKKSPKPQPQCVSNSAAASGPHTSLHGTDALANLPGSRNKPTRTPDPHPRGWVLRAGSPRPAPPRADAPPPQPPPTNRKIAQKQNPLGARLARPRQSRAAARLFC